MISKINKLFKLTINPKFEIVIVDVRDRVNCINTAIDNLKENGVIVRDDSERVEYTLGIDFLLNNNFKKIDFFDISQGLMYKKSTTIFYETITV
jgi:hypothetical protein